MAPGQGPAFHPGSEPESNAFKERYDLRQPDILGWQILSVWLRMGHPYASQDLEQRHPPHNTSVGRTRAGAGPLLGKTEQKYHREGTVILDYVVPTFPIHTLSECWLQLTNPWIWGLRLWTPVGLWVGPHAAH